MQQRIAYAAYTAFIDRHPSVRFGKEALGLVVHQTVRFAHVEDTSFRAVARCENELVGRGQLAWKQMRARRKLSVC